MSELLPLNKREFTHLRELIEGWCGIALDESKSYLVETRLRHLAVDLECRSYGEFYERARSGPTELRGRIIDSITTNETSWFRDPVFFDTLRASILPEVIEDTLNQGRRRIRIWSSACSTGQEPYSIGILLKEMERGGELQGMRADSFEVRGTDISQTALTLASNARYDPISMRRGLSPEQRESYFEKKGRVSILKDEVRKLVEYERFNLLEPMRRLGSFDLILMRNVLIYFSLESKRKVLANVAAALQPCARFAVGATETLELYCDDFQVVRDGICTYYRAKE